jgi:AraC-like DNA-binding protein
MRSWDGARPHQADGLLRIRFSLIAISREKLGGAKVIASVSVISCLRQYLERLRLTHTQRLLLTSDHDVLTIALDAGFGSLARSYVAFKRAFGETPPAYRRARSSF